eukprot:CAMPEP_0170279688 /NCGR_PEP_ID=MMETSP0116_2-20130129/39856_1 /TAXON_ID=400756 /ORGANISM="Durinskia baltica, Strain CSIRO CS-38" /LENGTH=368 /DNA_ID=CAMNT_0010531015 /DNA_START=35 /DNA_END=1138 /DNA_ORIENTATION=+
MAIRGPEACATQFTDGNCGHSKIGYMSQRASVQAVARAASHPPLRVLQGPHKEPAVGFDLARKCSARLKPEVARGEGAAIDHPPQPESMDDWNMVPIQTCAGVVQAIEAYTAGVCGFATAMGDIEGIGQTEAKAAAYRHAAESARPLKRFYDRLRDAAIELKLLVDESEPLDVRTFQRLGVELKSALFDFEQCGRRREAWFSQQMESFIQAMKTKRQIVGISAAGCAGLATFTAGLPVGVDFVASVVAWIAKDDVAEHIGVETTWSPWNKANVEQMKFREAERKLVEALEFQALAMNGVREVEALDVVLTALGPLEKCLNELQRNGILFNMPIARRGRLILCPASSSDRSATATVEFIVAGDDDVAGR